MARNPPASEPNDRAEILIKDRREVAVPIGREQRLEARRAGQREASGALADGLRQQRLAGRRHQIAVDKRVVDFVTGDFARRHRVIRVCRPLASASDVKAEVLLSAVGFRDQRLDGVFEPRGIVHFDGKFPARRGQQRPIQRKRHVAAQRRGQIIQSR